MYFYNKIMPRSVVYKQTTNKSLQKYYLPIWKGCASGVYQYWLLRTITDWNGYILRWKIINNFYSQAANPANCRLCPSSSPTAHYFCWLAAVFSAVFPGRFHLPTPPDPDKKTSDCGNNRRFVNKNSPERVTLPSSFAKATEDRFFYKNPLLIYI